MAIVIPLYRQSNKDLCLQCLGSLDKLIKFCKDNGVVDVNVTNNTPYSFNENDVVNIEVTGYPYATQFIEPSVEFYIDSNNDFYIDGNGNNYIVNI